MQLDIDFDSIERIFFNAWDQGRDFLFEYEVYEHLAKSGWWTRIQTPAIPSGCQKAQV